MCKNSWTYVCVLRYKSYVMKNNDTSLTNDNS